MSNITFPLPPFGHKRMKKLLIFDVFIILVILESMRGLFLLTHSSVFVVKLLLYNNNFSFQDIYSYKERGAHVHIYNIIVSGVHNRQYKKTTSRG